MCLRESYTKKIWKNIFFASLKLLSDPDPVIRGTDPRIRIRTKMSRIPNTGFDQCSKFGSGFNWTSGSGFRIRIPECRSGLQN
jgi:hypothetical protein